MLTKHISSCLGLGKEGVYSKGAEGNFRAGGNGLYFEYGGIYKIIFT